jgi:hypothetical protein
MLSALSWDPCILPASNSFLSEWIDHQPNPFPDEVTRKLFLSLNKAVMTRAVNWLMLEWLKVIFFRALCTGNSQVGHVWSFFLSIAHYYTVHLNWWHCIQPNSPPRVLIEKMCSNLIEAGTLQRRDLCPISAHVKTEHLILVGVQSYTPFKNFAY